MNQGESDGAALWSAGGAENEPNPVKLAVVLTVINTSGPSKITCLKMHRCQPATG